MKENRVKSFSCLEKKQHNAVQNTHKKLDLENSEVQFHCFSVKVKWVASEGPDAYVIGKANGVSENTAKANIS